MRLFLSKTKSSLFLLSSLCLLSDSFAQHRMSQIVFSFPSYRDYNHRYNQTDNILSLEITNTSPNELPALEHYDESLIKRVLVRDFGAAGSEVSFVLKDRNIRAAISEANEPFRIIVDFFDKEYEQLRDPVTGFPLANNQDEISVPVGEPIWNEAAEKQNPTQNPQPNASSGTQRRLLQPQPKLVDNPNELGDTLNKTEAGIGKKWKEYPPYIYRLQTASFHAGKSKFSASTQDLVKAISSAQAMADYAGRLYDFGHESRAALAYQQVLYKDPGVFSRDALHLWKFAETHLGQGNLTLADGYFQALVEKHPDHELSNFAKLRRLDIEAVRHTIERNTKGFAELQAQLALIRNTKSDELNAQIAIRDAFWKELAAIQDSSGFDDSGFLPKVASNEISRFEKLSKSAQGQRTTFLAASIALNSMIKDKSSWNNEIGKFASEYLNRFSGSATEPYREKLQKEVLEKLKRAIQKSFSDAQYVSLISYFESIDKNLQSIESDPSIAWILGESYRKVSQNERAIKYYELAARQSNNPSDQFKAYFWLAQLSWDIRQELRASTQNASRVSLYGDLSRTADKHMELSWNDLKEDEQTKLSVALKDPLEKSITSSTILKTPALIILDAYSKSLSTRLDATPSESTNVGASFRASTNTVNLLSALSKRFTELGMPREHQKALSLMRYLKPSDLKESVAAKKLWADELLKLAEEHRSANDLLEAGRLYAFTGTNAEDYSARAEALYKGGLLLYRAGRREEAISAFQKCSEDGDNRYYASLCLERLDKLNNQ